MEDKELDVKIIKLDVKLIIATNNTKRNVNRKELRFEI